MVDSGNQTSYEISTEYQPNMPMVKTFARLDGTHFARVEWEPVPLVENQRPSPRRRVKISQAFYSYF